MNIWQFQYALLRALLRWSWFSMALGALMMLKRGAWRGMGQQFLAWGAIDALIAMFGQSGNEARNDRYDNPGDPAVLEEESDNLRRILWGSAALDILYIIGGWMWMKRGQQQDDSHAKGSGLGVILQGLFLFVFDVWQAMRVPDHRR